MHACLCMRCSLRLSPRGRLDLFRHPPPATRSRVWNDWRACRQVGENAPVAFRSILLRLTETDEAESTRQIAVAGTWGMMCPNGSTCPPLLHVRLHVLLRPKGLQTDDRCLQVCTLRKRLPAHTPAGRPIWVSAERYSVLLLAAGPPPRRCAPCSQIESQQ